MLKKIFFRNYFSRDETWEFLFQCIPIAALLVIFAAACLSPSTRALIKCVFLPLRTPGLVKLPQRSFFMFFFEDKVSLHNFDVFDDFCLKKTSNARRIREVFTANFCSFFFLMTCLLTLFARLFLFFFSAMDLKDGRWELLYIHIFTESYVGVYSCFIYFFYTAYPTFLICNIKLCLSPARLFSNSFKLLSHIDYTFGEAVVITTLIISYSIPIFIILVIEKYFLFLEYLHYPSVVFTLIYFLWVAFVEFFCFLYASANHYLTRFLLRRRSRVFLRCALLCVLGAIWVILLDFNFINPYVWHWPSILLHDWTL